MEAPLSSPALHSHHHPGFPHTYFTHSTSSSSTSSSASSTNIAQSQTQASAPSQQTQQQQQPQGAHQPVRSTDNTSNFLQDFSLVAEAAKRAQMAVLMRDMEGCGL